MHRIGLVRRYSWWGICSIIKIYIILFTSVYSSSVDFLKTQTALISVSAYTILIIVVRPYLKNEYNNFDTLSNCVLMINCFVISYYHTDISEKLKFLFFLLLIASQLSFVLIFLWKFYKKELVVYISKRKSSKNIFVKMAFWIKNA